MKKNPLLELEALGQSIWIDHLGRDTLNSGKLGRLISEDGVSGSDVQPLDIREGHVNEPRL